MPPLRDAPATALQCPEVPGSGAALGDQGGQRRAGYTQRRKGQDQDIQQDIDHRGDDQGDQGRPAVACGEQCRGERIHQSRDAEAQPQDLQIGRSLRQQLLGGIQQSQRRSRQEGTEDADEHADAQGQHHRSGKMGPIAFPVTGAEPLGQGHGEAVHRAAQKVIDEPMEAAGRACGSERHGAQETAHDQAVTKTVKLLEQHGEHQRQREANDLLRRRADGHIQCHGASPSFPCE